MGVLVDFVEEVRTRLNTATGSGKSLEGVKVVRVGAMEDARKNNDLPYIVIQMDSGRDEPKAMNQIGLSVVTLRISLVANKLADLTNTLYKTSDSTGSIFLLESLLNTLDKNTSDVVDLQFSGTVNNLRDYSYSINEAEGLIVIAVVLEAEVSQFTQGAR